MAEFKETISKAVATNIMIGKIEVVATGTMDYKTLEPIVKLISVKNDRIRYYTTQRAVDEAIEAISK